MRKSQVLFPAVGYGIIFALDSLLSTPCGFSTLSLVCKYCSEGQMKKLVQAAPPPSHLVQVVRLKDDTTKTLKPKIWIYAIVP